MQIQVRIEEFVILGPQLLDFFKGLRFFYYFSRYSIAQMTWKLPQKDIDNVYCCFNTVKMIHNYNIIK